MKLTKSTYLLVLLLIGLQFCELNVFAPLFQGKVNHSILMGLWLALGYFKLGRSQVLSNHNREMKLWRLLMLGMTASYVTLFWGIGQNPLYSTWIYRDVLLAFISIPVLLSIQITKEDILKATWQFSLFYGFSYLLTIFAPSLLNNARQYDGFNIDEHDIGRILLGFEYLTVPLYLLLSRYNTNRKTGDLSKIIYLYSIIFLNQNRSTLFVATIFTGFFLWRSGHKFVRLAILGVIAFITLSSNLDIFTHLISQTQENLSDDEAHRNLAWAYYSEANFDTPLHIICGRGIESTHYGKGVYDMQELARGGITPSDVGYYGFMYVYGIIPILIFLYTSIIVALRKKYSWGVRMLGIHIMVGAFTISYLAGYEHGLWYALFFVLMTLEQSAIREELI